MAIMTRLQDPAVKRALTIHLSVNGLALALGALTAWALAVPPVWMAPVVLVAAAGWMTAARLLWVLSGRLGGWYDLSLQYYLIPRLLIPWRILFLWDRGTKVYGLSRVIDWWRLVRLGGGANRRFASLLEILCYPFTPGDRIPVGIAAFKRIGLTQPIALPAGGRHCIITGAPGTGKSLIIQVILGALHRLAACWVVDVDGAFVNTFGRLLEAAGHVVVKIDPDNLGKSFRKKGSWNLLGSELTRAAKRHGRGAVCAFATRLANALIVPDSGHQSVFWQDARVFVRGVILYVWLLEDSKTLMRMRELLTLGLPYDKNNPDDDPKREPLERLVRAMMALPQCQIEGTRHDHAFDDGCQGALCAVIAGAAGAMPVRTGGKENPFKITIDYQTAWIDDVNIRSILEDSEFAGEDLKFTNTCLFMVATLSDMQQRFSPFVRAAFALTTYAFECIPEHRMAIPATFILDEAPSINIEGLPTSAAGFRKYGVRLVLVTQSTTLLRNTYGDVYRDLYSMSQIAIFLGLDDPTGTLKFLSEDILGRCLRKEKIEGTPWYAFWVPKAQRVPTRWQLVERPLLDERQCAEFLDPAAGNIIVHRFGRKPMRLKQLKPFVDLPVWKYDVTPGYRDAFFRRHTRRLIANYHAGLDVRTAAFWTT